MYYYRVNGSFNTTEHEEMIERVHLNSFIFIKSDYEIFNYGDSTQLEFEEMKSMAKTTSAEVVEDEYI